MPTNKLRNSVPVLIATAAVALLLAACGGGGSDDEATRVARVIALINPDFRINAPQGDESDEATTDDDDE